MEEATMSQNAEMTATDNLEAAELSGTPTQSVKKPTRFSADAFRALSNRLNGTPTPTPTPPPETVRQPEPPEQIIPELVPELDVVPCVEVPIQPIPIIATPADSVVIGVEPVAAALPISEMVVEALAPDVASVPDVATVDVATVQDSVGSAIPQFAIPQVEIPSFSMPPAHDVVQPAETNEVLQEQVPAELSPIEQTLPDQSLLEQVTAEPVPLGNTTELDFLDLEQFTQAAPSSNLAPTDQISHDVEPLEEITQSSATNVGSLSLAEMLAAEPAIEPVITEAFEQAPKEKVGENVVQAAAPAPQVDASQIVEPVAEPLIPLIETPMPEASPEASPEIPIAQTEPSLDDLFANQAQPENAQPAFRVPSQEQLETPIASQAEIQSELPPELPIEVHPELTPENTLVPEQEIAPAHAPETVPQDIHVSISEPVTGEPEVPVQAVSVSEIAMDTAQQATPPIGSLPKDTPPSNTPPSNTIPTVVPSFSPQGDLDPLLVAMRLMQEVGPTFDRETSAVEQGQENEQAGQAHNLDETEIKSTSDVSVKVAATKVEPTKVEPTKVEPTKGAPAEPADIAEKKVDPAYELELEPDEKSGETARALLDMMSGAGGAAQPQERALAGDTLLQLVPRMPEKDLVSLSERVGMMDEPPALLVNKLINNRSARVAQPLLEGGQVVGDQDLLTLIAKCEVDRLTMISKRRIISPGVCDALIGRGEASVYLTLVRNPGASISHDAFINLCEIAKNQQSLQAPLATRGDTPPPIAFELFWSLPVELRRYVLSRFLTDSATLDKILKIAQSMGSDNDVEAAGDQHFPTRRKVDELVDLIAEGVIDGAVEKLTDLADIQPENARRIVTDPDGEPLTVALKTLGISRAKFNKAIKLFGTTPSAPLSAERDLQELQAMFDGLSFNKARTLMKYWDWAVEKSGPYARRSV